MWRPEILRLVNFMSHKESEFKFQNGVATMISGTNYCDKGTISNGSGKSAILEGICVSLINSSLRKNSAKELVRDGEVESTQYISLYNSILKRRLEITRTIFSNTKSGTLQILVNEEEPDIDLTNVDDGNKFILNELGVTREDLLNYFLISKERYESFLSISDTKKKVVISRFSQASLIDPGFEKLDEEIDSLNTDIQSTKHKQEVLKGKIEVYQKEIDNFSIDKFERARDNMITSLEEDKKENVNLIKSEQDCIDLLTPSKKELHLELINLGDVDFTKEIQELIDTNNAINSDIESQQSEYNGLLELESKIKKGLLEAVKCPNCSYEFSISNEKFNVKKARERKELVKEAIADIEKYIVGKNKIKSDNLSKISDFEKRAGEYSKKRKELNARIDALDSTIKSHEITIKSLHDRNKNIDINIVKLKEKIIEDERVRYQKDIDVLNKDIDTLIKKEERKEKIRDGKILLKETFVRFKTYLTNKAIGVIEAHANEYLLKTKTDLSIQLDGYKLTRTGSLKENISATVLRDGLSIGSFTRLSSGEKARIEIALIMALQRLINYNADYGKGLDLTWLDEIIESVDSFGIKGIMDSLNHLKQTIVVITHGTFNQVYPYMSHVIKEKSISTIIND